MIKVTSINFTAVIDVEFPERDIEYVDSYFKEYVVNGNINSVSYGYRDGMFNKVHITSPTYPRQLLKDVVSQEWYVS